MLCLSFIVIVVVVFLVVIKKKKVVAVSLVGDHGQKIVFPRNIANIRPIRMILFSKYSARDAFSMRQNGAEIGRIFITLQNKQGKTTKVSMLLFRLLVLT